MASLTQVFDNTCTESLLPLSRRKDIRTALSYLAASYNSIPDRLSLSESLEATYRDRLLEHFKTHPKGKSTIKNTIQSVGQFLKAAHALTQTPPVPLIPSRVARVTHAKPQFFAESPYRHSGWMTHSVYRSHVEQWPRDIAEHWHTYRRAVMGQIRPRTLWGYTEQMRSYLGYHWLTPVARLEKLLEIARAKLETEPFEYDLLRIMTPPVLTTWDELFQRDRLESFLVWHSWRIHTEDEATIPTLSPSYPTTTGIQVVSVVAQIAKIMGRPDAPTLFECRDSLGKPRKIHNKAAPCHRFELSELEVVAQTLMEEARQMVPHAVGEDAYPGSRRAIRFQTGLILAMGWRNPMRARNWCEAILGHHLKKEQGHWQWHFQGREMKVSQRKTGINIFEPEVSPDIAPALEEYLAQFRPCLPNSQKDRHVFLGERGDPINVGSLANRLKLHVYRHTGKRLYTHLLRTLFMTHHMTAGVNLNSIAYAMNDMPMTTMTNYNELFDDKHRPIIHEANQRALSQSNGHVLTPPVIPIIPKPPKPLKTDPDQIALI